ncbi:MAG: VapC toxin family PIN domain ribonuclease [Haliea sp.]|nr:VapC toxin family PIN domain ribonuclease [Haliea sp.]|tara:strand:+ start:77892 stop:78287 length:396 start_codon:yes stop_codon:yes gene_type:complete
MEVVADTNIFLAVALDEPGKARIIENTSTAMIVAPAILPYEVGNALSAMGRRGRLTLQQAFVAEKVIRNIPVRLVDVSVPSALELAFEFSIYAYDAYFLESARRLSLPLITLDRRMQAVASELGIQLLEAE